MKNSWTNSKLYSEQEYHLRIKGIRLTAAEVELGWEQRGDGGRTRRLGAS